MKKTYMLVVSDKECVAINPAQYRPKAVRGFQPG